MLGGRGVLGRIGRGWRCSSRCAGRVAADTPASSRLHHPRLHCPHGCLCSVIRGQLPQQVPDVLLHGLDADFERLGDLFVGQPEGDVAKNLLLSGRQA